MSQILDQRFGSYQLVYGIGWTPELWAGALVLATMSAMGLSVLAFPPALPTPLHESSLDPPSQATFRLS